MILQPEGGIVYRGIRNLACFNKQDQVVNPEAYFRREVKVGLVWEKKDPSGISVAVSAAAVFRDLSPKAVAKIESGFIRSLRNEQSGRNLEIFADPPAKDAAHGNIVEIPYNSDDPKTAEFLAGELARNSSLITEGDFRAAREDRTSLATRE